MELFIDSADVERLKKLWEIRVFSGITTNPIILARAGTGQAALVSGLKGWFNGELFIQAAGGSMAEFIADAGRIADLVQGRVVVKIPSTPQGFGAMEQLEAAGIRTAATALFTAGQGIGAARARASVLIPFYDRLEKSDGNPAQLLDDLVRLQNLRWKPRILVASLKTVDQVELCLRAGAWAVTLPPELAEQLLHSRLTQDAVGTFNDAVARREE
ncbi:MAG: transaldolase family protein [Pseudomonadota bacterium]